MRWLQCETFEPLHVLPTKLVFLFRRVFFLFLNGSSSWGGSHFLFSLRKQIIAERCVCKYHSLCTFELLYFCSSNTFIINETALFFVRRLYEFLRLWLGEFFPEGGEHVHQVPGVDAAVVILVKNPALSPWSISALQIICHKHSDWAIAKLKSAQH